LDQPLSNSD